MPDNTGAVGETAVARRPQPRPPERGPRPSVLHAAPAMARLAALSAAHVLSWSVGAALAGASYVVRRTAEGQPPAAILHDAAQDLRTAAWRALGVDAHAARSLSAGGVPLAEATVHASASDLQRRGQELLRRSNDVHVIEDTHPAFARILAEITPDEARVLRFLYLDGPQPAVDIRTFRPFGIGSELVAAGMSMVAEHAGLRTIDRIDQYLTNLGRLGLIERSREPVSNPSRYQVIEAQPQVVAALKAAGWAPKIIQRSIRLTSFGEEFVRTCLPLNGRTGPARDRRPSPR